jgi:DNA-binding NtrC family response regulator
MMPGYEPLVVVAAKDPSALQTVGPVPGDWGCRVLLAVDAGQLARALATETPALLLLDPGLEADGGERLVSEHPGLPVAFLIPRDGPTAPETAVRRGAFDFLSWPPDPHRLRIILAHAVERHRLLERIRGLEAATPSATDGSDEHLRVIDRVEKGAIVSALRKVGGNVREAARLLGYGQATVYRKIKRYGITLPRRGRPADAPDHAAPLNPPLPNPARSFE